MIVSMNAKKEPNRSKEKPNQKNNQINEKKAEPIRSKIYAMYAYSYECIQQTICYTNANCCNEMSDTGWL